jgi:archaellum component FlaG (FlaF/FlaG flagellin family)
MMKNKLFVTGILSILLVVGLILAGCDTGTNGGSDSGDNSNNSGENNETPTTGKVIIKNTSGNYAIAWVEVNDVTTGNAVVDEATTIATKGGSKTYTIDPGKYIVTIWDDSDYEVSSVQFQLNAGGSKTLTFTGLELWSE